MKHCLTLLFVIFQLTSKAQDPTVLDFDWERSPVLHKLSTADQQLPELVLQDQLTMEYVFNKKGELEFYKLQHVIIRVNSDEAINQNNKVYIPFYNTGELIKQKVRVINSKGKVINLDEGDIKEYQDESTGRVLKYFALEGIDMGSEIEYFFVLNNKPNYSGTQIFLQSETPKRNVEFTLITPSNLIMATKCYNNLPEPSKEIASDMNILRVKVDTMPALKDEDFSNWDAHLMKIVYKLDKNTANGKTDLTNYNNFSSMIYSIVYDDLSGAAEKKLKTFIKENNFAAITNKEDQIRAVEDTIKSRFKIRALDNPELSDIEAILKDRIADDMGILKLYAQIYAQLGITNEIVVTCSRYNAMFDPEFESYNFLETFLFYFPSIQKYLDPSDRYSRLGFVDYDYTDTYGLFIKTVEAGGFKSGAGQIKYIEPVDYTLTRDEILMDVDLNKGLENPVYHVHRSENGYHIRYNHLVYDMLDANDQNEIKESQVLYFSDDADIQEVKLLNTRAVDYGKLPLVTDAKFTSAKFLEKAGKNYLFNVGLLIGPQAELYKNTERQLPVEYNYAKWYYREITFTIPDGFSCPNLADLNKDIYQEKNGKRTMTFTSSYTQTGNTVKVIINEYYSEIVLPVEEFEDFRRVINASADFNKIALVLEPK